MLQNIYWRESKKRWYVDLPDGRQKSLGKTKKEAERKRDELLLHLAKQSWTAARVLTVAEVVDLFLEHCSAHRAPKTTQFYREFLSDFTTKCPLAKSLPAAELKPHHVSDWLACHAKPETILAPDGKGGTRRRTTRPWGDTTRFHAIRSLQCALAWAMRVGHLSENPLKHLEKPRQKRREKILTPEEQAQLFEGTDEVFRDVLTALRETGCRPEQICTLTADKFDRDRGLWVFAEHKTAAKTGRPYLVVLNPTMVALTERLLAQHPSGHLFRNRDGNPWKPSAIQLRVRRLRRRLKLSEGIVPYSHRHTLVTEAQARGLSDGVIAALVNHADTRMIRQYSHLHEKLPELREAMNRATARELSSSSVKRENTKKAPDRGAARRGLVRRLSADLRCQLSRTWRKPAATAGTLRVR